MKVPLKVKTAITIGFTLIILSLLIANTNVKGTTNFSSSFDDFEPGNFPGTCSTCHNAIPVSISGSGNVNVTAPSSVEAGIEFTINVSISGFTEAIGDPTLAVGFRLADANNSVLGSDLADRLNSTLSVDGSGNSFALFDFAVESEGNYNFTAVAISVDTGDNNKFYYLFGNTSVEITPSADIELPEINGVWIDGNPVSNSSADISETVTLEVDATDNIAVKEVKVLIDGSTFGEMVLNVSSNLYELDINTYSLTNGPIIVQIYAEDTIGNNVSIAYSLTVANSAVMGDITSYKMSKSEIVIGDGIIDDFWENVQDKFIVEELSSDSVDGWVKSTHDDYYLYMLVAYANERIDWVAFELDASEENMAEGNDGWIFGEGVIPYFGDAYYIGDAEHPAIDTRNDISYEMFVSEEEEINYIVFKRLLITNDEDGNDIDLEEGKLYNVKIASNGKATYHKDSEKLVYTLAISQAFPSGNTDPTGTTTTTDTRTPEEIKDDRIFEFFILAGLGVSLNLILIAVIFIFLRRN
ncbi:MAG: Ig-like domain-containing protein [Candidatus Kariarchaeaceae archaeon]|jgi:hypothetical protein